MSQRTALLISLMLTAIVGVAIVANRDRLLQASPAPVVSEKTAVGMQDDDLSNGQTPVASQTGARVLEVVLPTSATSLAGTLPSNDDERFDDDDGQDDDDRYDDHDHDDDDHDDDDHEDDDDH